MTQVLAAGEEETVGLRPPCRKLVERQTGHLGTNALGNVVGTRERDGPGVTPFKETTAVERMRAGDLDETTDVPVHALEADGARR